MEDSTMPRVKQASKQKRRTKAAPVLGVAGLSLSLTAGASATTGGSVADMPTTQNNALGHEITFGEEEISDVSLATFYVFDKENAVKPQLGEKLAWACRCGCGGCCRSWGRCRWC